MAKDIGGTREPGEDGTTVGQIQTPMCPTNVGRKNTPSVMTYENTMNKNSPGGPGLSTGSKIMGPGEKGSL